MSVSSFVVIYYFSSTGRSPRKRLNTIVITQSTSEAEKTGGIPVRNGTGTAGVITCIVTVLSVSAKTALVIPILIKYSNCSTVFVRPDAVLW